MNLRKAIFVGVSVFSTLCLAAGFAGQSFWAAVSIAIGLSTLWLSTLKWSSPWPVTGALGSSIVLATTGLLVGGSANWLLTAALLSLPAWDLGLLEQENRLSSDHHLAARSDRAHILALILLAGIGLCVVLLGGMIQIQLPFWAMLLVTALLVLSLDRFWRWVSP